MSVQLQHRYTLEEYLELERNSEARWEFLNGEVFCMSGVTPSHDAIEGNLHIALRLSLSSTCRVFLANIRIKVPSAPPYRYADLSCLCETPSFEFIGGVEALTNPAVIIEVLSPSTEAYDRGDKFTHYKSIASLREYVLVAQHRAHITHYVRHSEDKWDYEELNDLAAHITFPSLNCKISLADVYRDVALDQASAS